MKKYLLFLFPLWNHYSFAQNALVKMWDQRLGGTNNEWLNSFHQTSDGGYLLGGMSNSTANGDKTQDTVGGPDFWVVKVDSAGNKIWDKDFGGVKSDGLICMLQTPDGGFILGGTSNSGISGDKTADTWGDYDYWLVKIDSLGNKEWDKDFGGTGTDALNTLLITDDGGYMLGGVSKSGISGNKTEPNRDTSGFTYDYWIVKTDSAGNMEWDKDFGSAGTDQFYSMIQANDGSYMLAGFSHYGISGDKTQTGWGGPDFWIVKTDSAGIKLWDKVFGGTNGDYPYDLLQTPDGGYILAGVSNSDVGGDKSEPRWDTVGYTGDYWLLKIDFLGNKEWDRTFGGTIDEFDIGSFSLTSDGGFLLAGNSLSQASGNKTENNLGAGQGWVVKTDSMGNLNWEKTIFTLPDGGFFLTLATQSADGCYVFARATTGGIAGHKSQPNRDSTNLTSDYWIVKFCETLQAGFSAPTAMCPGTCVDFTNVSFLASSYQWIFPGGLPDSSTAVNPVGICYFTPGSYDVTLIASDATSSDTLTLPDYITVYPQPQAQVITQSDDTLFAVWGASSYQWFFNGSLISGATDWFYVAEIDGDYSMVATDSNGCAAGASIINVVTGTPFPDSRVNAGPPLLTVYPNPVVGTLTVIGFQIATSTLNGTSVEFSVYNVLGEIVLSACCRLSRGFTRDGEPASTSSFDCRHLPPGLYYLEANDGTMKFRAKFVKSVTR
jgi:PKD repeat protein